jgi:hypothetical protein
MNLSRQAELFPGWKVAGIKTDILLFWLLCSSKRYTVLLLVLIIHETAKQMSREEASNPFRRIIIPV